MKINIGYTVLTGLGAGLIQNSSATLPDDQLPNIIYIMSDDHAYQAISAYGGILKDYAPTPNIDRLPETECALTDVW
jgi:hypothetical protein